MLTMEWAYYNKKNLKPFILTAQKGISAEKNLCTILQHRAFTGAVADSKFKSGKRTP